MFKFPKFKIKFRTPKVKKDKIEKPKVKRFKIGKIWVNLKKKITSKKEVGGLEISDSAIRLVKIKEGKLTRAEVRLPVGVIVSGKIKNQTALLSALKKLHLKVSKARMKFNVVVSLPAESVYNLFFTLPRLNPAELTKAASLNLRMKCPLDFNQVYADWQIIETSSDKVELIGAYAEKELVDRLNLILNQAGFFPIAYEFPSLALARLMRKVAPTTDIVKKLFLVAGFSTEGLDLFVFNKGQVYHDWFIPWETAPKRRIKLELFKETIKIEIQKVLNFCEVNLEKTPAAVIVTTPGLIKEIESLIKEEFGIEVIQFQIQKIPGVDITQDWIKEPHSTFWFVALASALRGLLSPYEDNILTLFDLNVTQVVNRRKVLFWISLWRNIFVTCLIFLLAIFGVTRIFLARLYNDLERRLALLSARDGGIKEISELQKSAKRFNQLVLLVENAMKQKSGKWSSILNQLSNLAGSEVILDGVSIERLTKPVRIQARAVNEIAATNFRKRLEKSPYFSNVNLPLAQIKSTTGGWVSFSLTLNISKIEK